MKLLKIFTIFIKLSLLIHMLLVTYSFKRYTDFLVVQELHF